MHWISWLRRLLRKSIADAPDQPEGRRLKRAILSGRMRSKTWLASAACILCTLLTPQTLAAQIAGWLSSAPQASPAQTAPAQSPSPQPPSAHPPVSAAPRAPAPVQPAAPRLSAAASSQPALHAPPPPPAPAPPQQRPADLRFVVLLDPAHGGSDTGAMLAPDTPEKNYTLALAAMLHAALHARGIHSVYTRDADATLDDRSRAAAANRANASACILLHATSTGNGVHLFTSSLPPAARQVVANPRRSFLPWQAAQASYQTASLRLESEINTALAAPHISALLDRTSMMPLDSLACPAVAVEVAPLNADTPLADAAYQQKIVQALAAALIAWRGDWRLQP